ncbi:MAG: hypothetical protein C4539_19760 [Ignavibacteriales bacterium]|nr:MAG: hypothetical protein C4539_19760 [Ignavibacteriales bacterium]
MEQKIDNKGTVDTQLNVANAENVYLAKKTRFAKRFEKLNQEVASDDRYEGVMESLKHYLTKLDGVDMPTKLQDGGFTDNEIIKATRRKEKYAKRLEKNLFFESAQWIDSQIFAKIMIDFETYVEKPLINKGANKDIILQAVVEKVINPILDIINIEGEYDKVLNYTLEDVFGMVYYLTGMCHINWKNYDNI